MHLVSAYIYWHFCSTSLEDVYNIVSLLLLLFFLCDILLVFLCFFVISTILASLLLVIAESLTPFFHIYVLSISISSFTLTIPISIIPSDIACATSTAHRPSGLSALSNLSIIFFTNAASLLFFFIWLMISSVSVRLYISSSVSLIPTLNFITSIPYILYYNFLNNNI